MSAWSKVVMPSSRQPSIQRTRSATLKFQSAMRQAPATMRERVGREEGGGRRRGGGGDGEEGREGGAAGGGDDRGGVEHGRNLVGRRADAPPILTHRAPRRAGHSAC